MRLSLTISRYLIGAVVPYFIFAWALLSVILFVQQASRFSDIFFSVNIPAVLIWQLTLALVPSVISFTCPMAALVGVIIGLSKMQGDSEIVAIRAAGVGNAQITLPLLALGVVLSGLAFAINLYGVPIAAAIVRKVAIQTAIYKLQSPIEPGVFNTELAGYTVYVKGGDIDAGTWKNIFIHSEDEKTGTVRLITSKSGRIDTSGQSSELVLNNAVVSTFTRTPDGEKYASESVGEFRFAIKTRRGDLIEKLSSSDGSPEELGLAQLSNYAYQREGSERVEAQILWQRRIILSLTPIIFCLLGSSMILRFTGKGRGFGIFVALVSLIAYYLLAFLGEQLARTGRLSVLAGSLLPVAGSAAAIAWFNFGSRIDIFRGWHRSAAEVFSKVKPRLRINTRRNLFIELSTGLRDLGLLIELVKFYILTLAFLGSIFVIFTAFELWKFAGTMDGGIVLLVRYLVNLTPFVYLQLAPSAAMVATLATYVIKSRQNEIVTWVSAGQSTYRLLLPCFALMIVIGAVNWQIQERIAPAANRRQDELRSQLRSRSATIGKSGRYWVATDKRIYSFKLPKAGAAAAERDALPELVKREQRQSNTGDGTTPASDNESNKIRINSDTAELTKILTTASDNETTRTLDCLSAACTVESVTIYEFADNGTSLQSVYRARSAFWARDRLRLGPDAMRNLLGDGKIALVSAAGLEIMETANPFAEIRTKPSHLTIDETRQQLENSESVLERRSFSVALDKKHTTIVLPFIIALFTAPFALSLSRKGKVITVGYAVGLWLVFMAVTSVFEQLGGSGYLSSGMAIWSPLVLFSMLGVFLLSRVKT